MSPALKLDAVTAAAVDLALEAAKDYADDLGVGEHLGVVAEGDRVVTHSFACTHPGYPGWHWAVTLVRAARAKVPTVNEVALLPGGGALLAPAWVPWSDRIGPGDIAPGTLMPTPDNDPRLEPGYTAADMPADADPMEWSQMRTLVAELGLGRERVLSGYGRDQAVERWLKGAPGADNASSEQAPGECNSCGYFVALRGALGVQFGVCTNEYSPADAHVVSRGHGCGGHSDIVAEQRGAEMKAPVYDTIGIDEQLFD
ncbi:MAG: DUF3027 domain-containing protein [Propionibacteriaceae bacterium]|nr:DUF3027 domain-containing protein [Propionibacteriaceae bacterium]